MMRANTSFFVFIFIASLSSSVNGLPTDENYLLLTLGRRPCPNCEREVTLVHNSLDLTVPAETRSLDKIYQAALAEGGSLVVYAGGDTPDQQDGTKAAFQKRFPGIDVEIIVDFSKNHGPRIDYQLATNSVVFDITTLQTVQDFPRWKKQGVLLNYKPRGWDQVYNEFKDGDGAYTAFHIFKFSNLVNTDLMPDPSSWPREARDYLRPEFKDKIVLTYPHDDDAVLFWFKQIVDKYGWNYVGQLQKQNLTLVRSTQFPYDFVAAGRLPFAMFSEGEFQASAGSSTQFNIPKNDPFVTWPQTAAIFKNATHPETAKLYLNWLLDKENQAGSWSVRRDVPPPTGWKSIWDYKNTDPTAFGKFMADRDGIERFKVQLSLIFGEVQGVCPTGQLGTHPTKAITPFVDPFHSNPSSCGSVR